MINTRWILLGWAALSCVLPAGGQPSEIVFETARQSGKPVLLIFSGSDWCVPCRQLRKQVFDQPDFQTFADRELHLLVADFPQRKKLPADLLADNESLAARYNSQGKFPHVLLLDPLGNRLLQVETLDQSPISLKAQIQPYLAKEPKQQVFTQTARLMGSLFEFQLVAPMDQPDTARYWLQRAEEEVKRIEKRISSWLADSETARINRSAGRQPVQVSEELFQLIERCQHLSRLTQGAFDISYAAMDRFWRFDGSQARLPHPDSLAARLALIGYERIRLDPANRTVFLPEKGMKIGFGAVGKGYAADRVMGLWTEAGFQHALVNAGGDLLARGHRPDGSPWEIGIADPRKPDQLMGWLQASDRSIATSGDYERYLLIDGQRYSHIIDPRTGYPAKGLKSVTVLAPSAEMADALASAVFVLGKEVGLDLIDQLPETEALLIDDSDQLHGSRQMDLQAIHTRTHE